MTSKRATSSQPASPPATAAPATAPSRRPRVRRGNPDDALKLTSELRDAALALFIEGGLEAVSMRAVGDRVGVSAMTPYRYFEDKTALLASLWTAVMEQVLAATTARLARVRGGRARYRALVDSFLEFWETHPNEFRLVYQTQGAEHRSERPGADQAPTYLQVLDLVQQTLTEFAAELGVAPTHVKIAGDVSLAFQLGYLQAALVNRRYPWSANAVLREACLEQILQSVARCLVDPRSAAAPAARSVRQAGSRG